MLIARRCGLRPQAAEANANLGAVLQERGDLKGAREAYQQALAVSPELPGVLWNLAIAAERDGNAGEAEKLLERLLAVEPDWQDAAFRLGYLQLKRGEYAGAVDSFEACLKQRKDWLEALLNLGLACWKFGDLEAAASDVPRGFVDESRSTRMRCALWRRLPSNRRTPARLVSAIRKLDSLGAPAPELSYNLGLLLQSTGDYNAAAECYRATLQHKPQFSRRADQPGPCAEGSRPGRTGPEAVEPGGRRRSRAGGEIFRITSHGRRGGSSYHEIWVRRSHAVSGPGFCWLLSTSPR